MKGQIQNNQANPTSANENRGQLYRMLWRWHFYAGLICIPFIIMLSITGTIYLFKPQVEAAIDAKYMNLQFDGVPMPPSLQVKAALAANPEQVLRHYEMQKNPNDAAQIMIAKGKVETLVFVHPQNLEILKQVRKEDRFMAIARNIHGELLAGKAGSLIVEAAACWAIIMVVTGLYLWWPRDAKGMGGVLYPRKGRLFLRDLHAVTGIWVSFFALFLLLTGLPWTDVWGDSFKAVRKITNTAPIKQDWTLSRGEETKTLIVEIGTSTPHNHIQEYYIANIDDIIAKANNEKLVLPVDIKPPNKRNKNWVAQGRNPNRMLRTNLEIDSTSGTIVMREDFKDRHIIDKVLGVGISAHEGQLFGWFNQLLGVLTAIGLCTLSVSAFLMWRKRAPSGVLGAPPPIKDAKIGVGIGILIIAFGLFLPVLGAMILIIALIETLILRNIPPARKWLGLNV